MPAIDFASMFKKKKRNFSAIPGSILDTDPSYQAEDDLGGGENGSTWNNPPEGDRQPWDERLPGGLRVDEAVRSLGRGSSRPDLSTLGRTIEDRGRGARPFPQRRSDLGMGAYEENGEVKKMGKWEKALGLISSGVAGFGGGVGAGQRVSRDYFDRPYNEALGRAKTEEAQRQQEVEELGKREDRGLRRRQIEAEAARDEAAARAAAAPRARSAPGTITTDKGIMQWNPETERYDIPAGSKPSTERPDSAPRTITTKQGVMQWNPETKRYDIKAGDRAPTGSGAGAGGGGDLSALADTVIANPALYDKLTPTMVTKIAPELAKRGFSGFGTKLSDTVIGKLAESKAAVASLRDLRDTLNKNEQYIGPVSGLQSFNPWSDAKKAQSEINLVKQRVGKALEGGVLRKEDEEKYKRILATLFDTPSTAIYKVDNLIETFERDTARYVDELRSAGRRVPDSSSSGGSVAYTGPGGKTWNIPAAEATAFEKAHPEAKRSGR